jgi:histidyl-tRNA synthetase
VAKARYKAPRGTADVLPEGRQDGAGHAAPGRLFLVHTAESVLGNAGYGYFESPVFEDTALFHRGVGESTDIVQKEMFTFEDKGGRSLTLRPEGTAPVCRAYVEHGMHKRPQPVKLWYAGPFFRHERAQAGRYRQFSQIGAEALGSDDPAVDAETIVLLARLLERAEVPRVRLRLSSLGSQDTRQQYAHDLRSFLRRRYKLLPSSTRHVFETNPLRAFDHDDPATKAVMRGAPRLLRRLPAADRKHFADVRALLGEAGVKFTTDGSLVRGLDYYTRTVFEFEAANLGAQKGVAGGGRYDGLVEALGGPATPGVGWAAGVERILIASARLWASSRVSLFVVSPAHEFRPQAFRAATELWKHDWMAQLSDFSRPLRHQFRLAHRHDADWVLIVDEGLTIRNMRSGRQREFASIDEVAGYLRRRSRSLAA